MPNELVRNTIYKYGIIIIILRSASETKEEVFSMLKKSFAIGFALPEEDGDLRSFHFRVIELTVSSRRDGAGSWLQT